MTGEAARPLLVLASASPRRRDLLEPLGARLVIAPVEIDEDLERLAPGAPPQELAVALALGKACARAAGGWPAAEEAVERWALGADTLIVAPDGALLGKPTDAAEARAFLRRLDGAWHRVVTGVALLEAGGRVRTLAVESAVRIGPLAPEALEAYLASGLWRGKAGGYGIQDDQAVVTGLEGSRTNVIGLPMEALLPVLVGLGLVEAGQAPTGGST